MTTKLIIFILFFILLIRVINFGFKLIYKAVGRDPSSHRFDRRQQRRDKTKKGEINIDHIPNKKGGKFGDDYKGGEYVDYEELN